MNNMNDVDFPVLLHTCIAAGEGRVKLMDVRKLSKSTSNATTCYKKNRDLSSCKIFLKFY